jgi:hypothetical protein
MDEDQKVTGEICRMNPDGSITVFLHEPEHVEAVAKGLFFAREENDQLRRLLDETVKDSDRIEWLINQGLVGDRDDIDTLMKAEKDE